MNQPAPDWMMLAALLLPIAIILLGVLLERLRRPLCTACRRRAQLQTSGDIVNGFHDWWQCPKCRKEVKRNVEQHRRAGKRAV
jgi:hypothetical protein